MPTSVIGSEKLLGEEEEQLKRRENNEGSLKELLNKAESMMINSTRTLGLLNQQEIEYKRPGSNDENLFATQKSTFRASSRGHIKSRSELPHRINYLENEKIGVDSEGIPILDANENNNPSNGNIIPKKYGFSFKQLMKPPKNPFIKSHDEIVREYSKTKTGNSVSNNTMTRFRAGENRISERNLTIVRNSSEKLLLLSSKPDEGSGFTSQKGYSDRKWNAHQRLRSLDMDAKNSVRKFDNGKKARGSMLSSRNLITNSPLRDSNDEISEVKKADNEAEDEIIDDNIISNDIQIEKIEEPSEKKVIYFDKQKLEKVPRYTGMDTAIDWETSKRKMNKSKVDFRNRRDQLLVTNMEFFNKTQRDIKEMRKTQKVIEKILDASSSQVEQQKFTLLGIQLRNNMDLKAMMKKKFSTKPKE